MGGDGNRPEYGGRILGENKESKNCPPGRRNRGFLDQQFLIFHFKFLLTFHYAMISFCYLFLLTKTCYTYLLVLVVLYGEWRKWGWYFPPGQRATRIQRTTEKWTSEWTRQNSPPFPTSLLQTHTHIQNVSSMKAGVFQALSLF